MCIMQTRLVQLEAGLDANDQQCVELNLPSPKECRDC
jgi:hypothetical protein